MKNRSFDSAYGQEVDISGELSGLTTSPLPGYSSKYAVVADGEEINAEQFKADTYAVIMVNNDTKECLAAYNVHKRIYPASMTKLMTGIVVCDAIEQDAIILAKPNNQDEPQPFRIYRITKTSDMVIQVSARHIVYDLSKVTVEPFQSTGTIQDAITGMMNHAVPSCGFVFETDKTTAGDYKVTEPSSFRSLMGGVRGSLLDVYGTGEYYYDGYNIDLLQSRGEDRGVVIRYGISMIDLKQEEECEKVYTAVFPYWLGAAQYVQLDERIISVPGVFAFSRIMTLDLSNEFENAPTQAQLRTKAQAYIDEHDVGVPAVSLDVDFSGTEAEQEINLCDIVSVEFEKLGVTATAKCIELTYDTLQERVISVKLGNYKHTYLDTVVDQMNGITDYAKLKPSDIEKALRDITTNTQGHVLLHSSSNTNHIDEILILCDSDNLQTAQKIWRWNSGGIGFSSTGYNGNFGLAITMDGRISASFVRASSVLRAIRISTPYFNVYPSGYMTSTNGYIGDTVTGFKITNNPLQIKNSSIILYQMGLGFLNNSGTDMGYFGRTDRTYTHTDAPLPSPGSTVPDEDQYYFWLDPFQGAVKPGIGLCLTSNTAGAVLAKSNGSSNTMLFAYATNNATSGLMEAHKIHFYRNINMHGHGFYGDFGDTISFSTGAKTNWYVNHYLDYFWYMTVAYELWWNKFNLFTGKQSTWGSDGFRLNEMRYDPPITSEYEESIRNAGPGYRP